MTDEAYEAGKRAAAENIPAEANPHKAGTAENARWAEGHASVATAVEASESEGS